jgi:phenol 2-monooxygenase/3-hydroxybenzoate 4-monooxygenase
LRDYEKVFSAQIKPGRPAPDIFDLRGVNRAQGALVVVRPDQYIALVLPLTAHAELAGFFAGFMRPAA